MRDCLPKGVSDLMRRHCWRGRSCDGRRDHKRELDDQEGEEDDLAQRGRAGHVPGVSQGRPIPGEDLTGPDGLAVVDHRPQQRLPQPTRGPGP